MRACVYESDGDMCLCSSVRGGCGGGGIPASVFAIGEVMLVCVCVSVYGNMCFCGVFV